MSPEEKKLHQKVLVASFYKTSDYMIQVEHDNWHSDPLYKPLFVPASWQYLMTILHRYASRATLFDSQKMCQKYDTLNFNHDGVTFFTWHRYMLLFWERILQNIAWEEFHEEDYSVPYWDWIDETECEV